MMPTRRFFLQSAVLLPSLWAKAGYAGYAGDFAPAASDDLSSIEIPLRVVQFVSSQGKAEFTDGSRTVLTAQFVTKQVARINALYRPAGLVFTFNPADFEVRSDDYLNLDFDAPDPALDLTDHTRKPVEVGRTKRQAGFQAVADEKRTVITLIVHRGSDWRWDAQRLEWVNGAGNSRGGSVSTNSPPRVCTPKPRVWAHELGHTFGLPHISRDSVDAPSTLTTEADISAACQAYLDNGGNADHPEYAIDGDYTAGISDTPPDPGIGFWRGSRLLQTRVQIRLRDRAPFTLLISRNNIMAASSDYGGFTKGQIAVMRRKAEQWKAQLAKP